MAKKIYTTTEEIRDAFIKDGWNGNTSFSELTMDEAKEKGYLFAVNGISKGQKYFKMNVCGNIYDEKGKLVMYNIPCKLQK